MNTYKNYIDVLRHILKNFDDNEFDHIIKNILIKIFDIYYLETDIQLYDIDNVSKKCNMNMYNLLSRKYTLTKSKKNTFKILANSLFGVTVTWCEKFKNFKIVTNKNQVDKNVKKPNFNSRNIINQNLAILEMEKTSVTYSYLILIGSIILQNSKVHMYNYLYKVYPKLFGNDYKVLYMDTDSVYSELNMGHEEYVKILEKNKDLFGKESGQIKPESLNNPIQGGVFIFKKLQLYL